MVEILIKCLLILCIYKFFVFKILKFKYKWFIQLIVVYYLSLLIFIDINLLKLNPYLIFENLIFFSTFILAYLLFLTLIFNDSPTLLYLFKSKKRFLKKKFIYDRTQKLMKSGLINKNNKITTKGIKFINFFEMLSLIILSEKND